MTSAHQRRLRFFTDGARADAAARPDVLRSHPEVAGRYVCPLCLRAFPREVLALDPPGFSVDEAPPKASSRGPMARVLTCRPCNNEAGAQYESHLQRRRAVEGFGAGRLSVPTPVALKVGEGIRTQVEVVSVDGGIRMVGVPQATDPIEVAANRDWWDQQVADAVPDPGFTLHFQQYDHHLSQVALLKAAYLAGFAAFGYGYIWVPQLNIVRAKIRDPESCDEQRFATVFAPDQDPFVHRVLIAASPFRALCLQIGQDFVVLPWLDSPPVFWDSVNELVNGGGESRFTFDQSRDWPRFPEFRLDLPDEDPASIAAREGDE